MSTVILGVQSICNRFDRPDLKRYDNTIGPPRFAPQKSMHAYQALVVAEPLYLADPGTVWLPYLPLDLPPSAWSVTARPFVRR
jgi:hypothetical protein